MGVTDLFAGCAVFLAVGLFRAFDQTAIGSEILDTREAVDVLDLIEQI